MSEVVIVGAGAGGGAAAYALTRRRVRVLLLEAGPRFNPFADYRLDRDDWERQRFPHQPGSQGRHTFGELQRLEPEWDELRSWNRVGGRTNPGDRRLPYRYHHVRGVGGSTLAYTGEAHRLHPAAMRMRSRFGVGADWPLDYNALEPFYLEAERVVGVAGPADPGARWRSAPYPLPPHPPGRASQVLIEAAAKLDLAWTPNPRAALSRAYDGRPPCNYCGNCNRGCPRTDKGSTDLTFLRKAEASGFLTLETGFQVTRIEAGDDDRVRGLHGIDAEGRERFIPTPELILACGAVETPRLLLASAGKHAPDGLANESGQVGRHFMETLSWSSSALHPEPLGSHRGLPNDHACWDFNAPDAIDGVPGGVRFATGVCESGLNGPIAYAHRILPGWGRAHRRAMRENFGRALTVGAIGESLPDAGSFVDLDPDAKDERDVPLARIHSHLADPELRRLRFMARKSHELHEAAGCGERVEEFGSYDFFSSTHVFGTCRMGEDPGDSVVDSRGRSHRWRNLRLLDASIFPSTGGGESPSLTIHALALRALQA